MAKKSKKQQRSRIELGLEEDTIHGVLSVIFFVCAVFFLLAAFGSAGVVGETVYTWLSKVIGIGYFLLPVLALLLAGSYFRSIKAHVALTNVLGSTLFFLSGLGLIELVAHEHAGLVGTWIAHPLVILFDVSGSGVLLLALFAISLLILFNTHPIHTLTRWRDEWQERREARRALREEEAEYYDEAYYEEDVEIADMSEPETETTEEDADVAEDEQEEHPKKKGLFGRSKKDDEEEMTALPVSHYTGEAYVPPPLKIFAKDSGKPDTGDVKANANTIRRTMQNFGINVVMDEVSIGPSVTRYALKPAEGVRLSKILGLQKNLELALAASPVRIEAPIPGKSLVGIEVPNTAKTKVGLGALLTDREYQHSEKPLTMALGKDVDGNPLFANLAKMPHALIAGATGSGKSVTIHALVNSLLFRNSPEMLRFVMVDPKRVELTLYNGIPHLLTPVITDPKKAILALKWLVNEMERRYNVLQDQSVRDILSYHENILAPALDDFNNANGSDEEKAALESALPETMPYIVVIIDELADIMSTYPRELEAGIVRLAQMSRAVGIHLMLSTQRPSVNVITGLIKANIPARVALQVSSQIDSRTILDTSGAEKLLGAGDMLFLSGEMGKPVRVQSAFISEDEVKKVVKHLKKQNDGDVSDMELTMDLEDTSSLGGNSSDGFGDDDGDDLYEDARTIVIEAGKASTSYIQRKLRVGYARAARLMDMLEERGIIGPADGSKPRDVLVGDDGYGEQEDADA